MIFASTALAATRDVCIEVDHEFADTVYDEPQRYDLDDFLHHDGAKEPFRGVLVQVGGPSYLQIGYADDETGCRTFTGLTQGNTYTIKVWSEALVEGHTIELLDNDTSNTRYTHTFSWTVGAGTGVTKTLANGLRRWNIMTAATFAIHRRDGGLSPQTFTLFDQPCPATDDSCYDTAADAVYINSDTKFTVVHELGHYLAVRHIGTGGNVDWDAEYGDCHNRDPEFADNSHELQRKAYQTAAFWEGFADFYAAVVFNKTNESDCFLQYNKAEDFDLDDDDDPFTVNCAGVPWEDAAGDLMDGTDPDNDPDVGELDYFDDIVNDIGCNDVGGVVDNRATEYDYVRALWAMEQSGMSVTQMLDAMTLVKFEGGWMLGTYYDPIANDDGGDADAQLAWRLGLAVTTYDALNSTHFANTWSNIAANHGVDR